MRPEVLEFVATPGRLDPDAALALIRAASVRKRSFRLWTASRLLQRFGVPWHLPEHRRLLHRVDHVLRELESRGALKRRPQKQTSRNTRVEWAYELPKNDADEATPTGSHRARTATPCRAGG
jgi:hypothetical protein